ncbi:hypothetical protein CRE_11294 [Caenorhabditis remanei]|uniref:Uncharacterized protein n=1 Tax=Caenorhabditis remanei TaxID=31234 RepID=E3N0D8_CAERE|nr:hypothetical protein CRE_11294 [Caenorhabditis remanei]
MLNQLIHQWLIRQWEVSVPDFLMKANILVMHHCYLWKFITKSFEFPLKLILVFFQKDRHSGAINLSQISQVIDNLVAERSGSTLPVSHSFPVTPSIPRQNRKRRAETDEELCSPTPGSADSDMVFINSLLMSFTFTFMNFFIRRILEAETKKFNVTVSNVMTKKMPVGRNRYIQHFAVKDRREKRRMSQECNKLEWKQ